MCKCASAMESVIIACDGSAETPDHATAPLETGCPRQAGSACQSLRRAAACSVHSGAPCSCLRYHTFAPLHARHHCRCTRQAYVPRALSWTQRCRNIPRSAGCTGARAVPACARPGDGAMAASLGPGELRSLFFHRSGCTRARGAAARAQIALAAQRAPLIASPRVNIIAARCKQLALEPGFDHEIPWPRPPSAAAIERAGIWRRRRSWNSVHAPGRCAAKCVRNCGLLCRLHGDSLAREVAHSRRWSTCSAACRRAMPA